MLNLKKYYLTLLSSSTELATLLGENGAILSAYPDEVTKFPVIIYEDSNQRDLAFSDNLPQGTGARVRVHIYTKTVKDYPTTTALGDVIHKLFRSDYWTCEANTELSEDDNIKHRVMDFTREFYDNGF
jgi:hypothetical protein